MSHLLSLFRTWRSPISLSMLSDPRSMVHQTSVLPLGHVLAHHLKRFENHFFICISVNHLICSSPASMKKSVFGTCRRPRRLSDIGWPIWPAMLWNSPGMEQPFWVVRTQSVVVLNDSYCIFIHVPLTDSIIPWAIKFQIQKFHWCHILLRWIMFKHILDYGYVMYYSNNKGILFC